MYQINLLENYVVPEGQLTNEQYVDFVMNMAAKSYMNQYNVTTPEDGLTAARDAYNSNVVVPEPVSEVI
jgi:hypothetical protein